MELLSNQGSKGKILIKIPGVRPPLPQYTHPQHLCLLLFVEADNLTANNGRTVIQGEDVLDEGLLLPLLDHHVGYLDDTVLLWLWSGTKGEGNFVEKTFLPCESE